MNQNLKTAFVTALTTIVTNPSWKSNTGVLGLNNDDIAGIISDHIKPEMDGAVEFYACFDEDGYIKAEDEELVVAFEEHALEKYLELEREFIQLMLTAVKSS